MKAIRHLVLGLLLVVAVSSCGHKPDDGNRDFTPGPNGTATADPSASGSASQSSGGTAIPSDPSAGSTDGTSGQPGQPGQTGGGPPQPGHNPGGQGGKKPPGNSCGSPPSGRAADGRLQQKIVFPSPGSHQYPDDKVTLRACATSGLPVKYEFENGGRGGSCYVTDPAATTVGAQSVPMTCHITAIQAGNGKYAPAQPVVATWTVNKLAVTVGWLGAGSTLTYSGQPASVRARVTAQHALPALTVYVQASGGCANPVAPSSVSGAKTITITVQVDLVNPGSEITNCVVDISIVSNQFANGGSVTGTFKVKSAG